MWKNKPMVYLSGGISGKTYEDGNIWREKATRQFLMYDFVVANPLRDRLYKGECDNTTKPYTLNEIFSRDIMDLKYADVLFAELTCETINYFGTTSEIVIANREYDTPVVVWAGTEERKAKLEYSWIMKWAMAIIADFDEAIDYTVNLFNYDVQDFSYSWNWVPIGSNKGAYE